MALRGVSYSIELQIEIEPDLPPMSTKLEFWLAITSDTDMNFCGLR